MKITRIKEIKNIGPFSQFINGSRFGLEKLTFIYAMNTYGKTTLADIFRSLKENNNSLILDRRTIPRSKEEQKTVLCFNESDGEPEKEVIFQKDAWSQNNFLDNLEIFSSEFVSKNVINGFKIDRDNKENFTHFILGEQGGLLSGEIKHKNKILADKKKDLKNKVPNFVKNRSEQEIEKYINFSIETFDRNKIDKEIVDKNFSLKKEEERLKEPTKILNLPEPQKVIFQKFVLAGQIKKFNDLLQRDYSDIKVESLKSLNEHIKQNFSNANDAEEWIKHGLSYCKDKQNGDCPFCGQKMANAKDLIELYDFYFASAYINFIEEISKSLNTEVSKFESINFNKKTLLQSALIKINEYKGLIIDNDFVDKIIKLEKHISSLSENDLNGRIKNFIILAKEKVKEKNKFPYKKINYIEYIEIEDEIKKYEINTEESVAIIDFCIQSINSFKNKYKNIAVIQAAVTSLINDLRALEYQAARIKEDKDCSDYRESVKEILNLSNEIEVMEIKLLRDQSTYLSKYFIEINKLFQEFGSRNFTLEKGESRQGYTPVYSLKIKFKSKEIPSDKIGVVFSDSDKRSLALAIFWAKINLKTAEEKNKTVVILDDPVTSFDENRITKSISLFKDAVRNLGQLMIFTHYSSFIKRFREITKNSPVPTKMFEIRQNNITSYLDDLDEKTIIANDYEKMFLKIHGFINKKHCDNIKTDLRPFFENFYIPSVFAMQIKDHNISGDLCEVINGLFNCGAITEDDKNKFHNFRENLNPDSHKSTLNNEEDVRNLATEMMNYLFSLKF